MNIPTTSIVITAYNVERYIGRAIRSALKQSVDRGSYEVIVVNDASTDRSRFALEVFEDDIRLINNEEQLGLPASLNVGIREARGQYVVRIDGDDYVHEDFIRILEAHLKMNESSGAFACDYLLVNDEGVTLAHRDCLEHPIACGIMFHIEQLIDVGLYDEEFLSCEDEDLRHRFLAKHTIDRIQLPLYRYRRHENNMTNDLAKMAQFRQRLQEKEG
ncbi:MAG: glycosyltransferase family A protein [Actinomycetota bacterium]|nr:glycosyltransferase family A protein [Actinomycetota bacterium]